MDNYEIIRKDRYTNGRNGGGVCIYVCSNLNYRIRNDLMNENLEFLVGTWHRPPNSQRELLNLFKDSIERIDTENSELYLLGDLNCNLLSHDHDTNTSDLVDILDLYDLTQLITEPTRITPLSQTLTDLCITNYPEKISASGVIPLGISDHSLIYIVRKSAYPKLTTKIIKRRNFKHFKKSDFLEELSHLDLDIIHNSDDPNEM